VCPRRKRAEQRPRLGGISQQLALLVAPRQVQRVGRDHHRRVARDGAQPVLEGQLAVALGVHRRLGAEQRAHMAQQRPGRVDDEPRAHAPAIAEPHPLHRAAAKLHAHHARRDEPGAGRASSLQQMRPELLRAEPATAAGVQHRHHALRQKREVAANERPVHDQVRAVRLVPIRMRRSRPVRFKR
jgi:hypothetical protein